MKTFMTPANNHIKMSCSDLIGASRFLDSPVKPGNDGICSHVIPAPEPESSGAAGRVVLWLLSATLFFIEN